MIRAVVKTGQYSDPAAERLLGDVLIERRDAIGDAYLNAINPVVDVKLDETGTLTFDNAACRTGVAVVPAGGYVIQWARFDNNTGTSTEIGASTAGGATPSSQAPAPLPSDPGAYIKLEIRAVQPPSASWGVPIQVYFKRDGGWKLVGLERMP
jgi:hypothetical protein